MELLSGASSAITPMYSSSRLWVRAMSDDWWTRVVDQGVTALDRFAEECAMPIEQVAPECARLVDLDQEVEWLGSGFGPWQSTTHNFTPSSAINASSSI